MYALTYFLPGFKIRINFYKHEDIIKLLEEGKSLIRFGDGEIHIMNYGPVHYQKFEKKIRDTFFEIIRNYKEDSPYVLCLNELPITQTNKELRKRNLLHSLLPVKSYYQLYFPKNLKYFDQMFFYYNDTFSKYVESFLINKKVIVVTRAETITSLKQNPRMPLKDVVYIETPKEHAFSAYETISSHLDEVVAKSLPTETIVILAAFGPASKVLAYEYSMKYKNVIVIDIGRGIEILYSDTRIDDHIFPEYAP